MPVSTQTQQHHHRSTTKVAHKPYKPRFASKNSLKDKAKGKIERLETGIRKTPHQQVMSKIVRRNQAKQLRLNHHRAHIRNNDVFNGKNGAPRIVSVISLCENVSAVEAIRSLNKSLDIEVDVSPHSATTVLVERFKQKLQYVPVPKDLLLALEASKLSDYVVFLLSADQEVDDDGENIIRCVESQGVSTVHTMVQHLDSISPPKKRPDVVKSLRSFITHFLPGQEKVFSCDSSQECQNMVRSLCTNTPKGIRWREDRSWMLVEELRWEENRSKAIATSEEETSHVVLTGTVRGKSLKADRLLQIGDLGSFKIASITRAPMEEKRRHQRHDEMQTDQTATGEVLDEPTINQDTLDTLAPEEVIMEDEEVDTMRSIAASERKGVLLDDHRFFEDGEEEVDDETRRPKRLPKGTSRYQSAWYIDNASDSGSDLEDVNDDDDLEQDAADITADPADGIEGLRLDDPEPTEVGPSEYAQSEMFLDPSPEDSAEVKNILDYREKKRKQAEEDLRFPDEIELPPNVLARERLSKYRGLRSLRTSPWDKEEDRLYQPTDWSRLLEINDYKGAKSRVLSETLVGGVKAGTRVHIHLHDIPTALRAQLDPHRPLAAFSLLRHEHKSTALNFSIALRSDHPEPIRSKEELIAMCGPRRLAIHPLFSQGGSPPNNVHKFERYLHPGRDAIASFVGPLTWGAVPILFFKRSGATEEAMQTDAADATELERTSSASGGSLTFIGTGTALPASTSRVIAKRIILTGEPFKINRRLVTIRYMFFNKEDVQWFRALKLWTNHGRGGEVKDTLGTHGYFKAMFDGKVSPQDAVGVSLYKRVWPRTARVVGPGELWRGKHVQG